MDAAGYISVLMERTRKDPRIDTAHIGFLTVIVYLCGYVGVENLCFRVHRHMLMTAAKISSSPTLYRYLNQLSDYGYITYRPSRNPAKGTLIGIVTKQNDENLKIETR